MKIFDCSICLFSSTAKDSLAKYDCFERYRTHREACAWT
jgi:hypothetical protein